MSLYGFLWLNPVTKILRDVLDISYFDKIKTRLRYCACWNHNIMLQLLFFPIPIGVFLLGENILCLDNKFTSRSNLSINCCIILYWSIPMVCKWYFSHSDCNIPLRTTHCCSNVLIDIIESITLVIVLDLIHLAAWSDLPFFIKHIYYLPTRGGLHHSGWYFWNTKHNCFGFCLLQKGQKLLLIQYLKLFGVLKMN